MKTVWKFSPRGNLAFGGIFLIWIFFALGCGKKDNTAVLVKKMSDAVSKGYQTEVQKLVREHPKLVNFPGSDEMSSTPLHLAVKSNRFDIANFLLENGADINARNKHGMTPLHLAAMDGDVELVRMLLSRNARKDIRDYWGQSALMYATKRRHPEVAKLLQ